MTQPNLVFCRSGRFSPSLTRPLRRIRKKCDAPRIMSIDPGTAKFGSASSTCCGIAHCPTSTVDCGSFTVMVGRTSIELFSAKEETREWTATVVLCFTEADEFPIPQMEIASGRRTRGSCSFWQRASVMKLRCDAQSSRQRATWVRPLQSRMFTSAVGRKTVSRTAALS
uniref:(northern house mosquito) hypothetical protein n=1 Tax=Culex pipiens TaxID=7175 RepID=A0A8D8G2R0_CULPI